MDRKEAIKRTAALLGGAVFAPSLIGVLKGCTPGTGEWKPVYFNPAQSALTKTLSETIIPRTDTPGALDAGVPEFIERMVTEYYSEQQKKYFLNGMDTFMEQAVEETGSAFADLSAEERHSFAAHMNRESIRRVSLGSPQFFLMFKELVLIGFFTSEAGATQVLRYNPVPGYFEGCVSFKEIGRAWAI